eukprot:8066-Pelagomonas_calceolata.AAC.2
MRLQASPLPRPQLTITFIALSNAHPNHAPKPLAKARHPHHAQNASTHISAAPATSAMWLSRMVPGMEQMRWCRSERKLELLLLLGPKGCEAEVWPEAETAAVVPEVAYWAATYLLCSATSWTRAMYSSMPAEAALARPCNSPCTN